MYSPPPNRSGGRSCGGDAIAQQLPAMGRGLLIAIAPSLSPSQCHSLPPILPIPISRSKIKNSPNPQYFYGSKQDEVLWFATWSSLPAKFQPHIFPPYSNPISSRQTCIPSATHVWQLKLCVRCVHSLFHSMDVCPPTDWDMYEIISSVKARAAADWEWNRHKLRRPWRPPNPYSTSYYHPLAACISLRIWN